MTLIASAARRQYNLYDECRKIIEELNYDRERMELEMTIVLHIDVPQHAGKFTTLQQKALNYIRFL